jgi:4-hydroxyproline epimerase
MREEWMLGQRMGTWSEVDVNRVHIIDSHTAGEPTRVVMDGGPDLGGGTVAQRLARFRDGFDHFRSAVVNEPRGSDVIVGALLCEPSDPSCAAGVIYFNNVGFIGMCGHGTIGLAVTLAYAGRLGVGRHRIETAVGIVAIELHDRHRVTVANVPSYRYAQDVEVTVPGHGRIRGDVAWGGNWFFLAALPPGLTLTAANADRLTTFAWDVRQALAQQDIRGANGAVIDHIELFGAASGNNDSRNFVLCPGKAYDRSPCGTGTSAKLACLYADGKLAPGNLWRQESVIGTVLEASFDIDPDRSCGVLPRITGSAYVTADATLLLDEADPLRWGLGAVARS